MKSLLLFLLAGYGVRSDENNYYVVQMPDEPPIETKKLFNVYWNVPTMQCASKKIHFEHLYEKFGIIQNDRDRFKGEKITILYDPGLFPALFKNESSGQFRFRNGGVPQEGDLNKHLEAFKKDLELSIPDEDFSGVGIIDFESWRPVFRQNFGELQPYKDVSVQIEKELHWWWHKAWLEAEAKRRFEEAARTYMEGTLSVAKQLRPRARWGFYGFPYCFNMANNNMVESCATNVPQENDRVPWLWSGSTALYPSVYSPARLGARVAALVRGRVREAARVADEHTHILPYFWFRYRDGGFFSETDLNVTLRTLYQSKATGFIIWGSSNDVNTVAKCSKLLNYVENVLGPAVAKYSTSSNRRHGADDDKTVTSNSTTASPIYNDTSYLNANMDLDPEFHWTPPENYTQDIKSTVEKEIKHKFSKNDTKDEGTVLQNNNILIDLILNTVLNNIDNATSTDNPKTKHDKKGQPVYEVNTTETNFKENHAETSHIINSVVTKNPLINVITKNNTNSQVELLNINNESTEGFRSDDTTTVMTSTTTETTHQKVHTIKSDFESQMWFDSFTIPSVEKFDQDNLKEYDYDPTSDEDDDYVLNEQLFINNDSETTTVYNLASTTTDIATVLKDNKKIQKYVTETYLNTDNLVTESIENDTTTTTKDTDLIVPSSEFSNENSSTESIKIKSETPIEIDELIKETSSNSFVAKVNYILNYLTSDAMEISSTAAPITSTDNNSIEAIEYSTHYTENLRKITTNSESDEITSGLISTTDAYTTKSPTPAKIENYTFFPEFTQYINTVSKTEESESSSKNPNNIEISPDYSDFSKITQETEEITTLIAASITTTEQVVDN